jgi:hypothetical protein
MMNDNAASPLLSARCPDAPSRPSMEEISSRATIFELEGVGSEKRKYFKWLLAQSAAPKTKIESVITVARA